MNMPIYPITIGEGFPYRHIYPTHQRTVKLLMEYFPKDRGIVEVYLFGSIITRDTGQESDIDIVIVRDDNIQITEIPKEYRGNKAVDILNISDQEFNKEKYIRNSVYKDAYEMGIKIYAKEGV